VWGESGRRGGGLEGSLRGDRIKEDSTGGEERGSIVVCKRKGLHWLDASTCLCPKPVAMVRQEDATEYCRLSSTRVLFPAR